MVVILSHNKNSEYYFSRLMPTFLFFPTKKLRHSSTYTGEAYLVNLWHVRLDSNIQSMNIIALDINESLQNMELYRQKSDSTKLSGMISKCLATSSPSEDATTLQTFDLWHSDEKVISHSRDSSPSPDCQNRRYWGILKMTKMAVERNCCDRIVEI